jgi:hypothetical protein
MSKQQVIGSVNISTIRGKVKSWGQVECLARVRDGTLTVTDIEKTITCCQSTVDTVQ